MTRRISIIFSALIFTSLIFAPSTHANINATDFATDPAQPIIPVPPAPDGTSPTNQGAGLFIALNPDADSTLSVNAEPALIGTRRQRLVTMNTNALSLAGASAHLGRVFDDPGLLLTLFDDRTLVAVNTRITPRPMGKSGYIWFGAIPAIPHSNVILVVNTDGGNVRITGRILTHTANYYITPSTTSGGGAHRVLEINPAAGLADFPGAIHNDGLDINAVLPEAAANVNAGEMIYPQGTVLAEDDAEIDLMVVYTPATVAHFGDVTNTQTAIEEMVALTNQSYVNSNVSQQIRLIYTTQVDYVENPAPQGASYSPDLNALTGRSDNLFDQIHALRDVYGADLVMLLAGTPEPTPPETRRYCGIAWLLTGSSTAGFSVAESYCTTTVVMPHELGHNMGNTHDEVNGGAGGAWFWYSRGYQDVKETPEDWGDFVTVMAYGRNGQCPTTNPLTPVGEGEFCPHIAYWSDPDATYNGKPLGKANTHAALTLNQTSGIVAGFRPKRTVTQVVTDGGFEVWGTAPETPTWKSNGLRPQDGLVCDGGSANPARLGSCAFKFKGQPNENSQIFQKIAANTLGNGDVLMVDSWIQGINLSGGGVIQVRVNYQQDGKPNGKLDISVPGGTYAYRERYGTLTLTGAVETITLRVRFKRPQGATGRMLVDDIRLLVGELD